MIFSFDKFNRYEIPQMILCNPNFDELYVVTPTVAPQLQLRFTEISELSFTVDEYDEFGGNIPYFELLTKNRVIHLDGFGYWVIDSVRTIAEGGAERKEVHCFSYEYMLTMRNVDLDAGTYNFYDLSKPEDTLLGIILGRCPSWRIGVENNYGVKDGISNALIGRYRTFEMPDTSVYDFLVNEAAEAYEAVFVFDNENLTINAFTFADVVKPTDIILTWDNLMKSVEIEETDEPVITALDVYGSGDFSISSVNPLGTPTIYKFDHFKDQMSPELWRILNEWQNAVKNNTPFDGEQDIGLYERAIDGVLKGAPNIADDSFVSSKAKFLLEKIPKMEYKDGEGKICYRDYEVEDLKANASQTNLPLIQKWVEELGAEDHKKRIKNCVTYPVICLEDLRCVYEEYYVKADGTTKDSWNIMGRFDVVIENENNKEKTISEIINDFLAGDNNDIGNIGSKNSREELLIAEAIINKNLCEKYAFTSTVEETASEMVAATYSVRSTTNGVMPVVSDCEHVWDAGSQTLAPTCSTKGEMFYTCELCGATKVEDIAKIPNAHKWGVNKPVTPPTCTEKGYTSQTCSLCGTIQKFAFTNPAHTFVEEPAIDATESTPGFTYGKHCSVCGYVDTPREIILPDGSVGGECGTTENDEVYWYVLNDELVVCGTGAMADYTSASPAPWNDQKEIITKVTVQDGVTSVGNYAFYQYGKIAEVTMADSVTAIGSYAFSGCQGLVSFEVSVGVVSIGTAAFESCGNLESVSVSASVESVGERAFNNCAKLAAITVDDKNSKYASVDGVLFSNDGSILVCYPIGKADGAYVVPEGTETISSYAFNKAANIKSVAFPESLTAINSNASSMP